MKKLAIAALSALSLIAVTTPVTASEPAPAVVEVQPETHMGARKLGFYYHSYPLNAYAKGGWASMAGHRVQVYVGCSAGTSGKPVYTYVGIVSSVGTRSNKYCPSNVPFAHWVSYRVYI